MWKEIWESEILPRTTTALQTNEGTYDEALLIMERHGYSEETYYTFSYSPVSNDQGEPGGIICANTDDTYRIIHGRQLSFCCANWEQSRPWRAPPATRPSLGPLLGIGRQGSSVCLALPEAEPGTSDLVLVGAAGVEPGHPVAPRVVSGLQPSFWTVEQVMHGVEPVVVELNGWPDLPVGG